jgi:hypothetical protein
MPVTIADVIDIAFPSCGVKPARRDYVIPFTITGKLVLNATDKADAWRQALRFTLEELASEGDLEMGDPSEKDCATLAAPIGGGEE